MQAGSELDALISEKIGMEVRPFSTDISSAWTIIEKLGNDFPPIKEMDKYDDTHYFCLFHERDSDWRKTDQKLGWSAGWYGIDPGSEYYAVCSAWALTAPHAICLASLKAVGIIKEES